MKDRSFTLFLIYEDTFEPACHHKTRPLFSALLQPIVLRSLSKGETPKRLQIVSLSVQKSGRASFETTKTILQTDINERYAIAMKHNMHLDFF